MRESYLKDRKEYVDRYERLVVDRCRDVEKFYSEAKPFKEKKISKKQMEQMNVGFKKLHLYFETGELYLKREETIRKWMEDDERKDNFYESAQPPDDIRCLTCRNRLSVIHKDYWTELDKPDRVLFMFECPNRCMPRRAFFSDGQEWRRKPDMCPRCDIPLIGKSKEVKDNLMITHSCKKCKYTKTDEIGGYEPREEPIDENYAQDRDRFCLTDEEGMEYGQGKRNLEEIGKICEEHKKEEQERKERLKEHPEGFAIKRNCGSCPLCGQYDYGQDIEYWYDKWGSKCLVCQKAIDRKEIPGSLLKFKDSWYSEWEIKDRFNLKTPTLRKWTKEGILKARTISRYGKGVQAYVYLIKDNKDFLPPKKFTKSRSNSYEKDGKTWHRSYEWYCYADLRKKVERYKIMNYLKFIEVEKEEEKQAD